MEDFTQIEVISSFTEINKKIQQYEGYTGISGFIG